MLLKRDAVEHLGGTVSRTMPAAEAVVAIPHVVHVYARERVELVLIEDEVASLEVKVPKEEEVRARVAAVAHLIAGCHVACGRDGEAAAAHLAEGIHQHVLPGARVDEADALLLGNGE